MVCYVWLVLLEGLVVVVIVWQLLVVIWKQHFCSVAGDGVVDVDACGVACEVPSSMSNRVFTSGSLIFWRGGGGPLTKPNMAGSNSHLANP